jgi:hypothetical protein
MRGKRTNRTADRKTVKREIKDLELQIILKESELKNCGLNDMEAVSRDLRNLRHKLAARKDYLDRIGKRQDTVGGPMALPVRISNKLNFR